MQTVSHPTPRVNPHVAVVRDGRVFRWRRFDGRTGRTSSQAWTDAAAAVTAARNVAACYGVQFAEVRYA